MASLLIYLLLELNPIGISWISLNRWQRCKLKGSPSWTERQFFSRTRKEPMLKNSYDTVNYQSWSGLQQVSRHCFSKHDNIPVLLSVSGCVLILWVRKDCFGLASFWCWARSDFPLDANLDPDQENHSSASLHCFIFLVGVIGKGFRRFIEISRKVSLTLHRVEM